MKRGGGIVLTRKLSPSRRGWIAVRQDGGGLGRFGCAAGLSALAAPAARAAAAIPNAAGACYCLNRRLMVITLIEVIVIPA